MGAPDAGHCPSCGRTFAKSSGHCPTDGTRIVPIAAPAAQEAMVGRVLDGKYEVREPLAPPGKIGAMYLGWQSALGREVAIKVVHAGFTTDRAAADRFAAAARLGCQLAAPAIANVYDFGQLDSLAYVVSERVRGSALDAAGRPRTLPARRVLGIAMQLCDALDAAHRLGCLHGDLKPANILVDDSSGRDVVKVVDFGLARALVPESPHHDARRGPPLYLAPEQLAGGPVDARSDLYALGCVLHELLAGAPPFNAASIEAMTAKHRNEPPPALPPNVPAELAAVVKQLLAKAPGDRFATCKNLRVRLASVQQVVGTPPAGSPRVSGAMTTAGPYTRDPTTPPSAPGTTPPTPYPYPVDRTTPPTPASMPPYDRTTPPSYYPPRDPTTPPSYYPPRDPTTPPSYHPSPTPPPSLPPHDRTAPPSLAPYARYPPSPTPDAPYPPSPAPYAPYPPSPSPSAAPPSRRLLVIVLVALVLSAAGIAAFVLAGG